MVGPRPCVLLTPPLIVTLHMTFCHSIHALLHGRLRCTCLYFHTNAKGNSISRSDPNVRSTPHDMLDTRNFLWP